MLTRGVALEHLERTFGGLFVAASSEVSIGLVPVVIAARDPERAALIMVNLGGVDVLVAPDQRVSTTRGILLAAGGSMGRACGSTICWPAPQTSAATGRCRALR